MWKEPDTIPADMQGRAGVIAKRDGAISQTAGLINSVGSFSFSPTTSRPFSAWSDKETLGA